MFRVRLPPGEYELEARMSPPGSGRQPGVSNVRAGTLNVTVSGTPVSDLALQLRPGAALSGRVVFEGAAPPDRGSVGEVLIASLSAPQGARCRRGGAEATRARRAAIETDRDWAFSLPGLFGTCILSLTAVNLGDWAVAAAYAGDTDILDRPMSFESGQDVRDVRIVLSDRRTQLDLRVTDGSGVPTREYVALVFSVDAARWHPASRFVRPFQPSTRPSGQAKPSAVIGTSRATPDRISDLPRGDFFAIALDDLPADAVRSPETLAQLAKSATRLTVFAGTDGSVTLPRVSFDDVMKR